VKIRDTKNDPSLGLPDDITARGLDRDLANARTTHQQGKQDEYWKTQSVIFPTDC